MNMRHVLFISIAFGFLFHGASALSVPAQDFNASGVDPCTAGNSFGSGRHYPFAHSGFTSAAPRILAEGPSSVGNQPDTRTDVDPDGRFVKKKNGIVHDRKTGLQWYAGPDRATSWNEARAWVSSLTVDGGGWRLPTPKEVQTLYQQDAGERNMTPLLETTGWWVWTGQIKDGASVWYFDFRIGKAEFTLHQMNYFSPRGFAVRE